MMKNRVLRFFQQPSGVYHSSVFYQLSGAVGPSCLAIDALGNVYVGQFDVKESSSEGVVYVLTAAGKLKSTIVTTGAEISGLAIRSFVHSFTAKKYLFD
jgi:hypothetical protein